MLGKFNVTFAITGFQVLPPEAHRYVSRKIQRVFVICPGYVLGAESGVAFVLAASVR
jgi:hypothetical protein